MKIQLFQGEVCISFTLVLFCLIYVAESLVGWREGECLLFSRLFAVSVKRFYDDFVKLLVMQDHGMNYLNYWLPGFLVG